MKNISTEFSRLILISISTFTNTCCRGLY